MRSLECVAIIILLLAKFGISLDIESIKKKYGKPLSPQESAALVKREEEKTLSFLKESIAKSLSVLEKEKKLKEILMYMDGEQAGLEKFTRLNSIKENYSDHSEYSFEMYYSYLCDVDVFIMELVSCLYSYRIIAEKLLPNSVPLVTGEQLESYQNGKSEDSAASLFILFKYHIGIDKSCKAYNDIIGKILQDNYLKFIYDYSNLKKDSRNSRLYYLLEKMSLDSLREVFDIVLNLKKRELGILTNWGEESTLFYLYNNVYRYVQQARSYENQVALSENEQLAYSEIVRFLKEKNITKMYALWDKKFAEEIEKTDYLEIKAYIESLRLK